MRLERTRIGIYGFLVTFSFTPYSYAQTLGTGDPLSLPIGRMVSGLFICLIFAYLAAIMVKRLKSGRGNKPFPSILKMSGLPTGTEVEVVETKRLNAQNDVTLIRYASREFLVLLSANTPIILHEGETETDSSETEP